MDGAAAPPGARQATAQSARAASDGADVFDLGSAAVVGVAAGLLGLVEQLAQVVDALLVEGGRVGQAGFEVEHAAGLLEAVQSALAEEEPVGLHGEGGQVLGFEVGDRDVELLGDLLARVSLLLGEELHRGLDDGVDLVLQWVLQAAFLAHELLVEVSQTVAERAVVLGEGQPEVGGEDHCGERAFGHAQVVVAGGGHGLVGGDETLGHEEGDLLFGLGDGDVLDGEGGEELGVQQVSATGEDGGSLIHAIDGVRRWVRLEDA